MTAQVWVDGNPLHAFGSVSDAEWVTRWVYEGLCGDKTAAWNWFTDARPPWLHAGADVVIKTSGRRRWAGRMNEPEETDGGWACHAYGLQVLGTDYEAYENVAGPGDPDEWVPTTVPNTAVDDAVTDRMLPWFRFDDMGGATLGADDNAALNLTGLLERAARLEGKRASVDQFGTLRLLDDPTDPTWLLGGMSNYLGSADDELMTRLFGRYVSGVDGTTGEPNAWATVVTPAFLSSATMTAEEAKFGVRVERTVDLTALGLISSGDAQGNIDGRFALIGGRMGWTAGFAATRSWLSRASGEPGDPASIRAGQMIRLPGVRDFRTTTANRAAADVVIGEARYVADEDVCYITPMGYVPRDFTTALAAAQKPEAVTAA